ncbi:BglG family transcription antiterminator [Sutcliffiella cohnii]
MADLTLDEKLVQLIDIVQKKKYGSLEYFSTVLGVSTRSVRNYIKQINSTLDGIASIENERGKGYQLLILNEEKFDEVTGKMKEEKEFIDSPERRIACIIDRLLNADKNYTLDELAFELNLGRTTLVNELKKATIPLKTYNLSIYGKPNIGMLLEGEELNLRFFIIDNIFDFLYGHFPLDEDIKDEILRIANEYDLELTTKTRLMQFIIVMLDRLLKGNPLTEVNEKHNNLKGSKDYQIAQQMVEAIESRLPITIPMEETLFITLPIAGRRTPTNNRTMADISITEDVETLLENIMEQVGFNKDVIKENESFFIDLKYHLTFMLNRLFFGLRLKNPLLTDVKEKYPVAYKMAEIAGQVIETKYELEVSEDELGYIAFYFGVFIAQSEVRLKRLRKAAVICGTGRGTAKLVSIQLQRLLNENTEIDLFSETEVNEELLHEYDIAFSTIKLDVQTETPIIFINEIFDERTVSREIEKVAYFQTLNLHQGSRNNSFIHRLLNKDKFFLLDSSKGYKANVDFMVEEMVKNGYLDTDFLHRLKMRAQKGSMVFDNYVALPHTFNYQSEQIELAIGALPTKVSYEGKEVKLVFLLGIPEKQTSNNDHLLVKIYDEIIQLANNQQFIEAMATAKSYEQITSLLEEAAKSN